VKTAAAKKRCAAKPVVRKVRCAVYTRKSSEEGLDMEFNSLDAQREACEAYIASQRAEGWLLVPDRYDDGGISGGTLERRALRRRADSSSWTRARRSSPAESSSASQNAALRRNESRN